MAGALTAMIAAAFSGVTPDPYFEYTTLLLPGNGTNLKNNNEFLDSSTNAFTITRNPLTGPNAPTQGTFSPFSQTGWGNYFDGSSSVLTTSTSIFSTWSTANASTTTATIEAMVYVNALQSAPASAFLNPSIISKGATYLNFSVNSTGNIVLYHYDGSGRYLTSSGTIQTNTWNYVAVTITGGTATIYINGTSSGSGTWYGIQTAGLSTSTYIGQTVAGQFWNGYISNLRVSSIVRTIATPLLAYTDDGNTSFLTCQSNRFKDNSSNNFTITPSGNTSVVAFSPFNPTASWSAATYGGSGYFDGSGDYLSVASTSALGYGTGDFTIEFWYYPTSLAVDKQLWDQRAAGSDTLPDIYVSSAGALKYFTAGAERISGGTVTVNQWQHIALSKASGTTRLFLNGNQVGSNYPDSNNYGTSSALKIGAGWNVGDYVTGYIADARALKGTGYSTITVPTAPLTAITNTSLLLNFTNAGIYDATSKNDLETLGNAQISTAQSKWGGSSMLFNGTTDYMKSPASSVYNFGTGDWTIEFWYYQTGVTGTPRAFSINGIECPITTAGIGLYDASAALIAITGSSSLSTWTYYCACRVSGTIRLFKDGNLVGSVANSTNYNSLSYATSVGAKYNGADFFQGYLDDIRTSRYGRYVEGTGGNAGKMVFNGTNDLALPTAAFPTL